MKQRLTQKLKAPVAPLARWLRAKAYGARYSLRLKDLERTGKREIIPAATIDPHASADALWQRLQGALPTGIHCSERWLGRTPFVEGIRHHWQRYEQVYEGVGREKALEHALTFELIDFSKVRRYCDVAAASSPISYPLADDWDTVEAWRQDLLFETDLTKRVIGGYAQSMDAIVPGFFDVMTLHCSLEHFVGTSDVEFVSAVDRVLSPIGACLVLPLYVADTHRVYFDPTTVSNDTVGEYDDDGELYAVFGYHQEHGRFHSPETLASRLLHNLPSTLEATILRFHDQAAIGPDIYLRFALVLHRPESVFRSGSV